MEPEVNPAVYQAQIEELQNSLAKTMQALQDERAARLSVSAPRPPKPDKFAGERKGNAVTNWTRQMALYLQLTGLHDTALAVPHAVTYLTGAAMTWWRTLEASGPPSTWPAFATAIEKAFKSVETERIARDRLATLRQRTSVSDYADTFTRLLLDVPNIHPSDVVYRFLQGLKPTIRLHVELQRPATLDDAITLAQTVDSTLFSIRQHTTTPITTRPSPTYGPQPMELGTLRALTPEERTKLMKEGKCFKCRQPGHLARDCLTKTRGLRLLDSENDQGDLMIASE